MKGRPVPRLRYHLRFQIIPGRDVERDARDLAAFCRRHGVEEVVLFFAAEEWNNGLLSKREEDAWFDAVRRARGVLRAGGLSVSLNPWMTILHCDRGRRFPRGRRFEAAVSPSGEASRACGAFGDPKWRAYFLRLMGRFAALGFRVIWVEDDFRYHNHAPLEWGSGFEESALARFSERLGRRARREEVVRNVLRPGAPHPWRALWMATWREIQLDVARGMADVVARKARGRTQLGLMSSLPSVHSAEGRRWEPLFEALSVRGRVSHRPHFAGYSEAPGRQKTYSIMMLDLQKTLRPPACEAAPEIENFPFTRWTKSDSLTWSEMALGMFFGSDALLLDLFPFSGNRASEEPEIGELLDRSRPALEWIAERFSKTLTTCGVGLPWKQDAQEHVRTRDGKSLFELNASSLGPGEFLLPYGIAVSAGRQPVNAVFGSLAWAFTDDELREMLRGGLLLDGASAEILCRRGFGPRIGVRVKGIAGREEAAYAVERITAVDIGVRPGLCLNANLPGRMARLECRPGAAEWTSILTPDGRRFGAGIVAFANSAGGRVVTWAAPDPEALPRCYKRQALAERAVDFLAGGHFGPAMAIGSPHCLPMHFTSGDVHRVVVFNGSPDPAQPMIHVRALTRPPAAATLLAPLAKPGRVKLTCSASPAGCVAISASPIPYLGFLVLEWP